MKKEYINTSGETRQLLIKWVAVLMSLCYVLSPLNDQIGNIMHSLSHELQAPNFLISHASPHNDHSLKVHQDHTNATNETDHEHALIEFVQNLLESTNQHEQFPEERGLSVTKIDKHLNNTSYFLISFTKNDLEYNTHYRNKKLLKGHPRILYSPPI